MEVKILHEEENPLFNRKEIRFEVVHEGKTTPDLVAVKRTIANKTGSDASHVIIDGFKTLYGIGRTMGDARIYKNMNELKDYEPEYLLVRNKLIQKEKKVAEAPKEDVRKKEKPAEEAPKEKPAEKKEETPKESPVKTPAEEKKEAPIEEKKEGEK